jgi:RecG-like helicase
LAQSGAWAETDKSLTFVGCLKSGGDNAMAKENLLQRALRRFASSPAELESEELQRKVREEGAVPIQECEDRQRVQLTGTVSTVTITPRAGHPALEVELHDGSGTVSLVWLGRRQIPGIDPGRTLKIWGRISCHEGKRLIYNPRYELMQTPAAS